MWSDDLEIREEFNILLLNRPNHVLGWFNVSVGEASGKLIDPKLIFSVALKCNSQSYSSDSYRIEVRMPTKYKSLFMKA
ncbi:MAG: hypothetical protein JNL49_13055 [Bacteroidia bacterium]|nr:hypothetical protein [Bacteroidia bacterium]